VGKTRTGAVARGEHPAGIEAEIRFKFPVQVIEKDEIILLVPLGQAGIIGKPVGISENCLLTDNTLEIIIPFSKTCIVPARTMKAEYKRIRTEAS